MSQERIFTHEDEQAGRRYVWREAGSAFYVEDTKTDITNCMGDGTDLFCSEDGSNCLAPGTQEFYDALDAYFGNEQGVIGESYFGKEEAVD